MVREGSLRRCLELNLAEEEPGLCGAGVGCAAGRALQLELREGGEGGRQVRGLDSPPGMMGSPGGHGQRVTETQVWVSGPGRRKEGRREHGSWGPCVRRSGENEGSVGQEPPTGGRGQLARGPAAGAGGLAWAVGILAEGIVCSGGTEASHAGVRCWGWGHVVEASSRQGKGLVGSRGNLRENEVELSVCVYVCVVNKTCRGGPDLSKTV